MIEFSRFPDRKRFAVTFVDDTDNSIRENTEPVYEFLAKHRFWGTKTVWPLRARRNSAFRHSDERSEPEPDTGGTLEDSDYAAFICRVQALGFEVALHGVAAGNSRRDEIEAGLKRFHEVLGSRPILNAFHRTNIENLYCGADKLDAPLLRMLERIVDRSAYEGHREGTSSFWGDIAYDTFRYVRLPFHTIDEVNTLAVNPSMPFVDPRRPYVRRWFAASDGGDVVRFNRLLVESNIERLAAERGVCIIYTHFAKLFARRRGGRYELDEEFVRTVKRITARSDVWFASASAVLERLAAVRAMTLRLEGTRLEIVNGGDTAVEGLVLRVEDGLEVRDANGTLLNMNRTSVRLPRITAGETLVATTNRGEHQTILAQTDEISRRERRRIEYMNYLGLVRGSIRDRRFYAKRARDQKARA